MNRILHCLSIEWLNSGTTYENASSNNNKSNKVKATASYFENALYGKLLSLGRFLSIDLCILVQSLFGFMLLTSDGQLFYTNRPR